ncbi:hypothetical protein LTR78_010345 [Recurvomyces mirabilis]|uniref:Carboxylesterase type B domain-containing protein n=1 Tax=Recurvomyces mirabilis TaxID=574656 RepID=A0AAE0WGX7_9PEZI|nr:hypothetical protein LTR78_010345 [Recurvomyces mirabilis]KAK5156214.1 hypothetical protein LTS14_005101 [Recurvomyces mirabilis]
MLEFDSMYTHPLLGKLKGSIINNKLLRLSNIPYGQVSQRFSRSTVLSEALATADGKPYDATRVLPASIQPLDSASIDSKGNQFPLDGVRDFQEPQTEDCLNLNITLPADTTPTASLPVIVFVHGGAYFLGSGGRPYYEPANFCLQALKNEQPHIFVSINYRLGALGFFHAVTKEDGLMPPNNGLHDQLTAFEWLQHNLPGFGGDISNITALGQSAGGMSLTIHNLSGQDNLWRRSIQLSGSLVTMPFKTSGGLSNVVSRARDDDGNGTNLSLDDVVRQLISRPVDRIRDLVFVGAPCASSEAAKELFPYRDMLSMRLMRDRAPGSENLESQIVGSCTYDGGISYNMLSSNPNRKDHANTFIGIVRQRLPERGQELLELYDIKADQDDDVALRKICQFESDIGFFAASLAQAQGWVGRSYLLLFDLGNPFDGPLPVCQYTTHTWDIVSLLGAYEDRLDDRYKEVISNFRDKILRYAIDGTPPWDVWDPDKGYALLVNAGGVRVVGKDEYMAPDSRRGRLFSLADRVDGDLGCDILWDNYVGLPSKK